MTARYVRYTFIPGTINRCGKLSVLRFVTLTLGDGTMVRCYRHDQEDGGIAHTFQPCSTETFKSPSGTICQRGSTVCMSSMTRATSSFLSRTPLMCWLHAIYLSVTFVLFYGVS